MLKKAYNSKGFQTSLPWLILVSGIISVVIGMFGGLESEQFADFLTLIGKTFLTGGVFAVLLKSMQFMGVFKDELSKVVYEPKHLSKRLDLTEIWEKTSLVLFQDKFPAISQKLLKDVKEMYLPTRHFSYYEKNEHQLDLTIDPNDGKYIILKEKSHLELVCENKSTKTIYEFGASIKNKNYKLLSFSIDDNKNAKYSTTQKEINNELYEICQANLKGKSRYKIEKESERKINLEENGTISFRAKKIFHRLKIQIHHPETLEVEIRKAGTLVDFSLKSERSNFKEYYLEGLIYPEQGYFLIIKQK